jgi:hypothetical protein
MTIENLNTCQKTYLFQVGIVAVLMLVQHLLMPFYKNKKLSPMNTSVGFMFFVFCALDLVITLQLGISDYKFLYFMAFFLSYVFTTIVYITMNFKEPVEGDGSEIDKKFIQKIFDFLPGKYDRKRKDSGVEDPKSTFYPLVFLYISIAISMVSIFLSLFTQDTWNLDHIVILSVAIIVVTICLFSAISVIINTLNVSFKKESTKQN